MITTPVLSALREAYPQARITMVVNPGTEDMVRGHPDLAEVLPLPRAQHPDFRKELPSQLKFIKALRIQDFDISIDFTIGDRGAILSFLSGAPQRLGFTPRRGKQWWWRLAYTRTWPQPEPNKPIVESHLEMLRLLGLKAEEEEIAICLVPGGRSGFESHFVPAGGSKPETLRGGPPHIPVDVQDLAAGRLCPGHRPPSGGLRPEGYGHRGAGR